MKKYYILIFFETSEKGHYALWEILEMLGQAFTLIILFPNLMLYSWEADGQEHLPPFRIHRKRQIDHLLDWLEVIRRTRHEKSME